MSPHGTFHWNELMTHDAEEAKAFYGKTIGWTFDSMPMPEGGVYWVAKMGDMPVGGIFQMEGEDFEDIDDHWMPYLSVDNVDTRVKAAEDAGAEVMREAFDVPGVGRIVILEEPGGAMVGWMTPAPRPAA